MVFNENRLLGRKFGKMSQNLSSAAVVIGALRVKNQRAQRHIGHQIHDVLQLIMILFELTMCVSVS